MKKNILLISAVCALLFSGCEKRITNPPRQVYLRSYVMGYYQPEKIELDSYPQTSSTYPDSYIISVDVVKGRSEVCYLDTDPEKKAKYDELCIKHGDMSYNGVWYIQPDGGMVEFPELCPTSIEVRCLDRDFDADHPAGSLLNDLMSVCLHSPMPYIKSGYDPDMDVWELPTAYRWSYIDKPLPEVVAEDMMLLGTGHIDDLDRHGHYTDHIGLLIFDAGNKPDVPGAYDITVTFFTESVDAPKFEATTTMDFSGQSNL